MLAMIINNLPLFVAPFVLFMFSLITAYVWKFKMPKGGLGFDYVIFTVVIVFGLIAGGAL